MNTPTLSNKVVDTQELADLAFALEHTFAGEMVEICSPHPDNPAQTIFPVQRRKLAAALRTAQCSGDTQELRAAAIAICKAEARELGYIDEDVADFENPDGDDLLTVQAVERALRTTHSPSEVEVGERIERWRKASIALGAWMSAALDDPKVCDAMKADINEWFSAGEPFAALSLPSDKTVELLREELEAALDEREQERGRLPDGSPHWSVRARELLAKLDSHLGEMK